MFRILFLSLLVLQSFSFAEENCRVYLKEVRPLEAMPGQKITLFGEFPAEQGSILPVANKGRLNRLEVLAWSKSRIEARLADDLSAGSYKVGLYCQDPSIGSTRSSGFLNLRVLGKTTVTHSTQAKKPKPIERSREELERVRLKEIAARAEAQKRKEQQNNRYLDLLKTYWYLLLIPLLFIKKRGGSTITMPAHARARTKPKEDLDSNFSKDVSDLGWVDSLVGIPFKVDCYYDQVLTVEIEGYSDFPFKGQIYAEEGDKWQSSNLPENVKREIKGLFKQGVNYVDLNYNSDRIAAEVPDAVGKLSKEQAKKIAFHLVAIRKYANSSFLSRK
ncbi:MAG: hypothetical protein H6619_05035 [Deltaproteobacteria bacterium]|nr:hypothetical protein [Deltaproteobacteria bacterium]